MRKILAIAIAVIALMACEGQNKYDAALDEYEALVDKMTETIKKGDEKAASELDRQLTDLGPVIQEIEEKGSDAQKKRKKDITLKFLGAMFSGATPSGQADSTVIDNDDFEKSMEELGEDLNKAADGLKDALDGLLD